MNNVNPFNPSTNFDHFQCHPGGQWEVHTANVEQPRAVIHNGPAGTQISSHDQVHLQGGIPANISPLLMTSTSTMLPETSLRGKSLCSVCKRPYPRRSRAEACENSHTGAKPFACQGACGILQWYANPRLAKIQLTRS
jgi:hypothetical protein